MSFLRKLFGVRSREPSTRRLHHPRDLREGDIIEFGLLDQPEASGKAFEVKQVNTYLYGEMCYPELVLEDRAGVLLYLMVEDEDGESYLALSKKIEKARIDTILARADIEAIAERHSDTTITMKTKPADFAAWLASNYKIVDHGLKGAFIRGDARYLSDAQIQRRESFTSYILEDPAGELALEIERYATGEIELSATAYHDIGDIKDMWPRTE